MKAIILAGGSNEELFPFTATRPKAMLPVSGEPILETTLKQLAQEKIYNILIIVKHHKDIIQNHFQFGKKLGITIRYLIQEDKGIGSALLLAKEFIGDDSHYLLIYGDSLVEGASIQLLLENFYQENKSFALVAHPISQGHFGNVYINHLMKITNLIEKPEQSNISNYVLVGRFILPSDSFQILEEKQFKMVKVFEELIKKEVFYAALYEDDWVDVHYPWHLLQANQLKMNTWKESIIPCDIKIDSDVDIKGSVHIGKNVFIGGGTKIVGPCYIGDNVFIGNNTLIREYSSIGSNSVVGFGCEIKNSILLNSVKLGRLSFIGDSIIGEDVRLGSGVMTVNNLAEKSDSKIKYKLGQTIVDTGLTKLGALMGDKVIIGSGHTLAPGICLQASRKIKDRITITE